MRELAGARERACACAAARGRARRGARSRARRAERLRSYFHQLRREVVDRLLPRLYNADGTHSKWWFLFAKHKFMNKSLSS